MLVIRNMDLRSFFLPIASCLWGVSEEEQGLSHWTGEAREAQELERLEMLPSAKPQAQ